MSKTAVKQKKIYDGKEKGYVPVYADKKQWKAAIDSYISRAKNKVFGTSLKAVRNIKEIEKLELKKGEKVLDAGCGGGILLNQLATAYGIKGYGVDLSTLAVQRAKECGNKKIIYKNAQLEKLPFRTGTFDAIVSFDVLEHVENKEKALKELIRVLKPGGRMLLYIISKRDLFTWHWFLRIITFGRFGKDTDGGHFRHLFADPGKIKQYLKIQKCSDIKTGYFHSFFTLLIDEILFKIINKRYKDTSIQRYTEKTKTEKQKGMAYRFLYAIHPIIEFLEIPWKIFGLSNGFFVRAKKNET